MSYTEEEYLELLKGPLIKKPKPVLVGYIPSEKAKKAIQIHSIGPDISIFIPHKYCTLNEYIEAERRHRQIAAKIKKSETAYTENSIRSNLPDTIIKYPVRIKFVWYLKDRKQDPDNVAFAKKFVIDGLVKAGLLKNDGQKQIKGFTDDFINDPAEGVKITFEEV